MNHDRIHRIEAPTPFPVGPVNVYLIEGESPLLIDAGLRTPESIEAIEAALRVRGLEVSAIERIVLTHHHVDHAGGARRIQERSGAQVFAHPGDRERLARGDRHPAVVEALTESGLPHEVLERLEDVYLQIQGFHDSLERVAALENGEILTTGAGPLRVLHTPGHTQGSLCLWDNDGTLLSGDTVLERITPNAILDGDGRGRWRALPVYVRTLAKLAEMRPERVLPGHGKPFTDMKRVVEGAFARYRERGEKILAFVRKDALTVAEIGERLFGPTEPASTFLVISEVYGNLDLLEAHGLVEIASERPPRFRGRGTLGSRYPRLD